MTYPNPHNPCNIDCYSPSKKVSTVFPDEHLLRVLYALKCIFIGNCSSSPRDVGVSHFYSILLPYKFPGHFMGLVLSWLLARRTFKIQFLYSPSPSFS